MTPEQLKQMLQEAGLRPVHDRGQNFLMDESVVSRMVEAAGVEPNSRVLEIGAGPGILTEALLEAGAEVVAVEIDLRLCKLLRNRFSGHERFKLVEKDVLVLTNRAIAQLVGGGESWQVVANLPYAITSAVLEKFIFDDPKPQSLTLMLQREVVDRLLAKNKRMSSLAVNVQALADVRRVIDVPKGAFWPMPKVDSAVIHIRLKNAQERRLFFQGLPESFFQNLVRSGFSHKRRQLKNNLQNLHLSSGQLEKMLIKAKIKPTARPEELSVKEWLVLAKIIHENNGS